jgi:hypothetical protein
MKFISLLFPVMAAGMAAPAGRGGAGGKGAGNGAAGTGGATATQGAGAGTSASANFAGGANNAGAQGQIAQNGLPQLPNPNPNFNAATSNGDLGPFTPVSSPAAQATGGPQSASGAQAQALQAAADNWSFDTGMVSNFQNTGKGLSGAQFNQAANVGYNAEVDELTHKAILDNIIGNDPDVSIANLTLTNGVFQSVVNNLQIMSFQGKTKQALIDQINMVRCTQILPSIDTYLAVAARTIGQGATLRTAIRPDACAAIVAGAPDSAFPGNLQAVDVRSNTDKITNGNSFAGAGTPTPPTGATGNNNGATASTGAGGAASGASGTATGAAGGASGAAGTPKGAGGAPKGAGGAPRKGAGGAPKGAGAAPKGAGGTASGAAGTATGAAGAASGATSIATGAAGAASGATSTATGTAGAASGAAGTPKGAGGAPKGAGGAPKGAGGAPKGAKGAKGAGGRNRARRSL